jgi:hypothetical protein
MPPLLAALFLIDFGCDMRIITAIDLAVEWKRFDGDFSRTSVNWYDGSIGFPGKRFDRGSYLWPRGNGNPEIRYYKNLAK